MCGFLVLGYVYQWLYGEHKFYHASDSTTLMDVSQTYYNRLMIPVFKMKQIEI